MTVITKSVYQFPYSDHYTIMINNKNKQLSEPNYRSLVLSPLRASRQEICHRFL